MQTPGRRFTRRRFLGASVAALVAAFAAEAWAFEPRRLRITKLRLSDKPRARFVVWSDFHYEGDADYADKIVATINGLKPDFVCFLGDLVHTQKKLEAALEFVAQIRSPVYGVAGNHDYGPFASFTSHFRTFEATGGAWLMNRSVRPAGGHVELCGSAERYISFVPAESELPRVLLTHYPIAADETNGRKFSVVLAGHSHGGQIRLPGFGALLLPSLVGRYELGRYATPAGPLYVTSGVGTYRVPLRFNCPPEIVVVEV